MFEIHPSASENFDSKVKSLIGEVVAAPRAEQKKPQFEPEIHIAATITDKDIIEEPSEGLIDYRGNAVGRFFVFEGIRYGIFGDGHKDLVRLAESIQKLPVFRERIGRKYIEDCIFLWLKSYFSDPGSAGSFMEFLKSETIKAVKPVTVFVPVANAITEVNFRFCGAIIRSMTKAMVEQLFSIYDSISDEESRKNAEKFVEDFRGEYQGYVVVQVDLTCELEFASDLALEIANRATDLLGIYSGAVLIPDVKCVSRPKGSENLAQFTTVTRSQDGGLSIQKGILDRPSARHWHISNSDLESYIRCGLGIISEIVTKQKRTDMESAALNMAFLYSKAAFTSEPMEKLVHMLSALESTLLRNESEPIQQNLAERLAFFTAEELLERKSIIKNVRHVYGLRSRYLHHGHSSSDLEELSAFFRRVWIFYVKIVINSGKFNSRVEFLDAIDDCKFT